MLHIKGDSRWKVKRNILRPKEDTGKNLDVQGGEGGFLNIILETP